MNLYSLKRVMNNQRGGIISNIFLIPVGVALMVCFFFLGYYVGKYQSNDGNQEAMLPPLPEVVSKNMPKREEFTFYKTLSDREQKTVSIELKPRRIEEIPRKETRDREQPKKEKKREGKVEKPRAKPKPEPRPVKKETAPAPKPEPRTVKKETAPAREPDPNVRYTLQIASYQEKESAEEDVRKMKKLGYAAFIVPSEIEGKGKWYRVRLGSFSNKASAEKLQRELKTKEGINPFISVE